MADMYHYQIGTHTAEQYKAMRESICSDDNEYTEFVRDCTMEKEHSETRGVFYLSESEADIIKVLVIFQEHLLLQICVGVDINY